MTPCRVVDTRASQGFPPAFGPPSLAAGTSRTFPLQSSATCSIPAAAQAYSFNVTVVPSGSTGFITAYPTGQSVPLAATLVWFGGALTSNAAIVPAGTGGSVDVYVNTATDLVIDINGYYTQASNTFSSFVPTCDLNIPGALSSTPVNLGTLGTFTKQRAASSIVIDWGGHVNVGAVSNAVYFFLEVDGVAAVGGQANGLLFSADAGRYMQLPMHAVFTGLSAGTHNVEMWASIPNGSGSDVAENPGCYSEQVVIQEL
jgi:hypothetical protein